MEDDFGPTGLAHYRNTKRGRVPHRGLLAALVFVVGCAPSSEVILEPVLHVVVDGSLPTSLYVQGLPRDEDGVWRTKVGEVLKLVSWPAEAGKAPAGARVPGHVMWSVEGRSDVALFVAVDDTLTLVTFTRPSPPGEPYRLRAEMKPLKRRIAI